MLFRPRMGAWLATFLLVMGMATLAQTLHVRTIIFPETAALALGVWVLRDPEWLNQPRQIVLLPTLCAALGVWMNHWTLPTMERELLILGVVLVILTVTRSSLSPAISAGMLPIVLNIQSWVFVYAVLAATGAIWIGVGRRGVRRHPRVDGTLPPWRSNAVFAIVAALWIGAAATFGIRDAVLPPLMVFLYGAMKAPPKRWGDVVREIAVLLVAAVTSSWAVAVLHHPIAVAALALTATTLAMRFLNTWVPPAGAVALLPLVLPKSPVSTYPILVAILALGASSIGLISHRWSPDVARIRRVEYDSPAE